MATTAAFTVLFKEQGYLRGTYGPALIGAGNNTDALQTRAYPFGVAVAKLVSGTAPTSIQLQGSNDAFAAEVVNLGPAVTASMSAGVAWTFGPAAVPGSTATANLQAVPSGFEHLRWIIVGGDATTILQIDVALSTPRG